MTFWQLLTFRQRKLCVLLIAALIISAGCTARQVAAANPQFIVSCEYLPWPFSCKDDNGGAGGGSGGAGFVPPSIIRR